MGRRTHLAASRFGRFHELNRSPRKNLSKSEFYVADSLPPNSHRLVFAIRDLKSAMTNSNAQTETIFLNALEISSPDVREAYIAAECRGNHQMRREVQDLVDRAGRLGQLS